MSVSRIALPALLLSAAVAQAAPVSLIGVNDPIIQTETDRVTGATIVGDPADLPGGAASTESPRQAIDNSNTTKYLNFQGAGLDGSGNPVAGANGNPTGFVVTLTASGPSAVNGFQFTTANDFASRDPGQIRIDGVTATGTIVNVYSGPSGIATFANGGSTGTGRQTAQTLVTFPTSAVFPSYRLTVTDLVRYTGNSPTNMQFAEFDLFFDSAIPEPTSLGLLGLGGLALLRRRAR